MFKTFPEFSKLTLNDREEYESFIKDFPPVSEISFTTMMTWWNVLGTAAVAQLHGGLVLSQWLPGDQVNSGLSFVGTKKVDESLCAIFDYLCEKGDLPRLVHVPEFVATGIRYPELFKFAGERDYDEYIIPVSALYPLDKVLARLRINIRKTQKKLSGRMAVKSLDLRSQINQGLLLGKANEWWREGAVKAPQAVKDSMNLIVKQATALGVENVCLYIDGELKGFYLYEITTNPIYATANYWNADWAILDQQDFMLYLCAERLAKKGVEFINLDFDLGNHFIRARQLVKDPANYFRKYTVEPTA